MHYYYVSRIISSAYLRPRLLLGSAGLMLGATLVLFLAADHGATARAAWPAPTDADAPVIELPRSAVAAPAAKQLAGHAAPGQPLAALPEPHPTERNPDLGPEPTANRAIQAPAATYTASAGRLVQHSWTTIKSMFR